MNRRILICIFIVLSVTLCVFLQEGAQCSVESMLLGQGDFPVNTKLGRINSPIAEYPKASAAVDADYGDSAIYQVIGRYPTVKVAKKEFEEKKEMIFDEDENGEAWERPSEFSYISPFFQNYYVACGNVLQGKYQCRMIGQYDEYYVFFFAYISNEGVTFEMFEDFLQKIDARIEQCLQN